jgi:hypothetical protein
MPFKTHKLTTFEVSDKAFSGSAFPIVLAKWITKTDLRCGEEDNAIGR